MCPFLFLGQDINIRIKVGEIMFHKVKEVRVAEDHILIVQFTEGVTKQYDVKPLMESMKPFERLEDELMFESVTVSPGGYGVIWDDGIDLSCNELYTNGVCCG